MRKRESEKLFHVCIYLFFFRRISIELSIIICSKKMESKIIKSALYVIARLCKLTGKIEFLRDGKERTEGILFNVMKSLDEKHARFKSVRWDELWAICMCVAMKRRWEKEGKKKSDWLAALGVWRCWGWCLIGWKILCKNFEDSAIISNVNLHLNICLRNYK